MKKFLLPALLVISMGLLSTSCSKDGDEGGKTPVESNTFTYDNQTYELFEGDQGNYAGIYETGLSNVYVGLYGESEAVFFDVHLPADKDHLVAGTYNFNADLSVPNVFGLEYSYVVFDVDGNGEIDEEVDTFCDITAGKLIVSVNNDIYTLNFDCTANGKKLVGKYVGTLEEYDPFEEG